jgi:hypothetical protein
MPETRRRTLATKWSDRLRGFKKTIRSMRARGDEDGMGVGRERERDR